METKLEPEFKAKWVAALRSGEYKQGFCFLHNRANNSYCCLGVACKLAGVESSRNQYITGVSLDKIPYWLQGNVGIPYILANLNDEQQKTFPEISDYIEQNL